LEHETFWLEQHIYANPDDLLGFDLQEYLDSLVSFLILRAAQL